MILEEGDRIEDLQCQGFKIIQNKNFYTFTSDSVLLANFVKTKAKDNVVEIGAGCGVISILVQAKNKLNRLFAFEIQEQMQNLCLKNLEINNLKERIELICDDVNNFERYIKKESVDVVFSNPPYFKKTNFEQNEIKQIAKEEIKLSLKSLIGNANKMLKNGGVFYCCYGADRICELITECQNNDLIIKELFFTENGKGKVKLALIKAVKKGKNGVKVYPNLITNDTDGNYLELLQTRNFIK